MIRQGWSRTVRLSGPNMNELHGFTEERIVEDGCRHGCDCATWRQRYLCELGLRRRIVAYIVSASILLFLVRLFLGVFYG